MPLRRTPPPASPALSASPAPSASTSSPKMAIAKQLNTTDSLPVGNVGPQEVCNVTFRKRRTPQSSDCEECDGNLSRFMSDMRLMLKEFQKQQDTKYDTLLQSVHDIKASLDFLSQQNDVLQAQVNKLEAEQNSYRQTIAILETKIENDERHARASCIEIRNIPAQMSESKRSLVETVSSIGKELNINIQQSDIRDVFRVSSKQQENRTIIVDLGSVLTKEKIITAYRGKVKSNNHLTTEKLKICGPTKRIFISENLSTKQKKLFYLSREFAKMNDFMFCWVTGGKIFLRKREGDKLIKVSSESDLRAFDSPL